MVCSSEDTGHRHARTPGSLSHQKRRKEALDARAKHERIREL
jgi:hypothetical protein